MKIRLVSFVLILSIFLINSTVNAQSGKDSSQKPKVVYAGARSSSYGIRPFPNEHEWGNTLKTMSSYFPGSTPAGVWIVGELSKERGCRLFFPSDGKSYPEILFIEEDKHEPYLDYFDKNGIKVFLQVEPGNADMITLIDLVLSRYKHHPCVIGFGVDVEWNKEGIKEGFGVPVSDKEAELWEQRVKSHNPEYRLFLKHWDREWMPPSYRGDIIFITDSQQFESLEHIVENLTDYWAKYFYPSAVGFQIGYGADSKIWGAFENPPRDLGKILADNTEQECGIYWVDFTLRKVKLIKD